MAQIDASIPLGVRPVQIESPVNQLAKVLQIRGLQQESEMGRMKMDEYRRGIQESNRLADLYRSGADANALRRAGFGKQALEWDEKAAKIAQDQAQTKKYGADAEKVSLETNIQKISLGAQILSTARDQASYDAARATAQANGLDVSRMPPQFDPAFVQSKLQESQTIKEQLEQVWKQKGYDLDVQKFGETARHNRSTEGLTARGQNMTDARARENAALTRQGLDLQRDAQRVQIVETPQGVMLVDKGTGQARPATSAGQPLPGKPNAATEKELVGIRQQNAIIDGALDAVSKTPDAFSLARGTATMAGALPESIAGRFDTDAQRQARSYVFNNVSKVINERAGAAQSAQELARLRSFLPAETDNADQIKSKLTAFKTYLSDMEAGTKGVKGGGATGGWSIQKVN